MKQILQVFLLGVLHLVSAETHNKALFKTSIFNLPPFTLVLEVTKPHDALIVFQDRLESSVTDHLTDFFKSKVDSSNFGSSQVGEVALSSRLVWRDLLPDLGVTDEDGNARTNFQVRADFEAQVTVVYDSSVAGESRLSKSMMDLFLIEAFEGDNYWHLVHHFLSDDELEDISDVKVTVVSDGFVANDGQDESYFDRNPRDGGVWTKAMTVGVVLATFFCLMLIAIWLYLCLIAKSKHLFKKRRRFDMFKDDEAVTETNSAESCDYSFDEESQWMDDWAESITSIFVRDPVKTKHKMMNSARHPAQQHRSFLESIEESGGDDTSCASTDDSDQTKTRREQQSCMAPQCTTLVPYEPNNGARRSQFAMDSQLVLRELPTNPSHPRFVFERQPDFEYQESKPQLELV